MAVSLILPFCTLIALTKADAQFAQLPSWAVVQFTDRQNAGGDFGKTAAEAVTKELNDTEKYTVESQESVARVADSLGLQLPLSEHQLTSLLRLGQELHLNSIVTGEIVNYRVVKNNGTKHADVIMRVIVTDVASGLPVNGAALIGHSVDRAGDAKDETLINEAISAAASDAVSQIEGKTLPTGTILNTLTDTALLNQGARTGFQNGQTVVVLRGREEVATATVFDVEPDSAQIKIKYYKKGLQPGDRVRVVFSVPEIEAKWPKNAASESATPIAKAGGRQRPATGFTQILLLFGLLSILFMNGHGSNQNNFTEVTAEPGLFIGNQVAPDPASGTPGVRVSWRTDMFIKGNQQKFQYQIWREAPSETIAQVAPGSAVSAVDSSLGQPSVTWYDFGGKVGGDTCANTTPPVGGTGVVVPGVVIGQPYTYGVELVYKLSSLDLPAPPTTVSDCYFVTQRAFTPGSATPLASPQLTNPTDNTTITGPLTFSFNSVQTGAFQITADYIVELSTSPLFTAGQTVALAKFTSNQGGTLSTQTQIDTTSTQVPTFIRSAQTLYWRIGARNTIDVPGPVPDNIGQRYVFSTYRTLTRPLVPPGGP